MRVGGIASGMDIEAMVKKLMEAEQIPLTRLQQQQTSLEWKRDAFRDINSKLLSLDNMMVNMKLSSTYKPKSAVTTGQDVVTVTANSDAANGSYKISVEQLASNEMHVSGKQIAAEINLNEYEQKHTFTTYQKDGNPIVHSFTIEAGDSLQQVLKKIEKESEGTVRAFYDATSEKVIIETTRTGAYNRNENGSEIEFNGDFFTEVLQLQKNKDAKDAEFTYNDGITVSSKTNDYTMNGMHIIFHDVGETRVTVATDVEQAFDTIKQFVEKYNEVIDIMNRSQTEERFRDFLPLTKEQEEDMTERQIEQWEAKAKSGLLRGEGVLRDGMYALRQSLQSMVGTEGSFQALSQIGITTTVNYLDGGKLKIDETKLKDALRNHPDDVYALFTSKDTDNPGLIHRFDEALDKTRARIEAQAGSSTNTMDNYALGKEMKALEKRIDAFQMKMVQVEDRYWRQFTQMEKAIARLNQQADYLYSQFGG